MIAVRIAQLSFSNMGFVVVLRGEQDPRSLPVFVGATEAQAIALYLEHFETPRPLTHDLFKNVLDNLECRLQRVEINDLHENTFYAKLFLECHGLESVVDARPSDAMALALRCGAPIFVAKQVMQSAGVILPEQPKPKPLLSDLDTLKQQLSQAVAEERFEDAARLRDEIKKLTKAN